MVFATRKGIRKRCPLYRYLPGEGILDFKTDTPPPNLSRAVSATLDVSVTRRIEGAGKLAVSLGAMVVRGPTGVESEIDSFQLTVLESQKGWSLGDTALGF
jgi:hypothetical protein